MELIEVNFNDEGDIIDTLSGKILKDTPEERVRQRFINILQSDYGYPKNIIAREVPVQQGSKILSSDDGAEIRADIVVYTSKKACLERDQGNILFVVECKKPNATEGYSQLVSYIFNTSAVGGVWTNGNGISVYKKKTGGEVGLDEILTLPRYRENWSGSGSIPSKSELPRPHNVRFLLSSCHNKLYGRGMENEDFDLAMDMKKDILKISEVSISGVYCKHIDEAEWTVNSRFRVFTFPDAENFGNRKMTADQLEFDSGDILYDMIEYHDSVEIAYFFDPVIMLMGDTRVEDNCPPSIDSLHLVRIEANSQLKIGAYVPHFIPYAIDSIAKALFILPEKHNVFLLPLDDAISSY